jgi:hypothetical protein
MRYESTNDSAFFFLIIITFHIFLKNHRAGKFSTCEVYGEMGYTTLECRISTSFSHESEPKIFYMINYSNQLYNNQFNYAYNTD